MPKAYEYESAYPGNEYLSRELTDLDDALSAIIPGASLRHQTLDNVPEICLTLIDDSYPRQPQPPEVMQRIMDNPLYWIFCWASGQVLARFILDKPDIVRNKRVLDFGCGSGVVAIAAKLAGAREVIACDIDPLALKATRLNAEKNGVELVMNDDFDDINGAIDLIVVADVLYDQSNLRWLTRFTERAPAVLIADSRIKNFDVPPYVRVAQHRGATLPDLDESEEFREVSLYTSGWSP